MLPSSKQDCLSHYDLSTTLVLPKSMSLTAGACRTASVWGDPKHDAQTAAESASHAGSEPTTPAVASGPPPNRSHRPAPTNHVIASQPGSTAPAAWGGAGMPDKRQVSNMHCQLLINCDFSGVCGAACLACTCHVAASCAYSKSAVPWTACRLIQSL